MRPLIVLLICALTGPASATGKRPLTVGISTDMPPYVMQRANEGLAVAILRAALPNRMLRFVQVPYGEVETTIGNGKADAAAFVQPGLKDIFYSNDFITFMDSTFSKKSDGLSIRSISDLAGKPVLTWQGAWRELGPEFEALFRPGGPRRTDLEEFVDQKDQVDAFWARKRAVAVIDRNIFEHFSGKLNRSTDDVVPHSIFPPSTAAKVGFRDAATRDAFNLGLAGLCSGGKYAALIERYEVVLRKTVCE